MHSHRSIACSAAVTECARFEIDACCTCADLHSPPYFHEVVRSVFLIVFFFSSRRRHTRLQGDWSSDVCSSDLQKGGWNLVDVRSPDEFTGKVIAPPGMTETAQRGGHIPGATSIPWSTAVNQIGRASCRERV